MAPLPDPVDDEKKMSNQSHPSEREPWSLENEKNAWGMLSFPELLWMNRLCLSPLTATQIQGYVTQKLCPRWARFQRLNYQIESHPRFYKIDQEINLDSNKGSLSKSK